jgi:hypothetical protein
LLGAASFGLERLEAFPDVLAAVFRQNDDLASDRFRFAEIARQEAGKSVTLNEHGIDAKAFTRGGVARRFSAPSAFRNSITSAQTWLDLNE